MVTSSEPHLPSPILPPAEVLAHVETVRRERRSAMRSWAIVAAALFHVALFVWLWFVGDGAWLSVSPPPIPVHIVYEEPPPPPPPAPPVTAPEPPPPAPPFEQPKQLKYRESGKDLETKALKPADTVGPEEAAPPDKADAAETATKEKPSPAPAPVAPPEPAPAKLPSVEGLDKPKQTTARPDQRKPAREARAPQLAPLRAPGIEFGDKAESGDPYLNKIQAMLDRERYYPPQAAPLGLQGVVYFMMVLGPMGNILVLEIEKSSGVSILDDAARDIILRAAPFPPLPNEFPSPAGIRVPIPMFPPGRSHG
jgi:protein TonB